LPIHVRLLYFGQARDAAGKGEEDYVLPDGSSVDNLVGGSMQAAVNEEIAEPGQLLRDGDVVALLPPVAGG
jgi:molybdopterin synthase catalytic subunit